MGRGNQNKRAWQVPINVDIAKRDLGVKGKPLIDFKRSRPTGNQAPPTLPNVDVHGILFALVAIVFVVYPLAQWALGL
jgi:hypothetical protein